MPGLDSPKGAHVKTGRGSKDLLPSGATHCLENPMDSFPIWMIRIPVGPLLIQPSVPQRVSFLIGGIDECLVQNMDLAREILDDAGIVNSDGDGVRERDGVPLKILFQTSTNSVRQITQERIKAWWAELGVETELKNIDPAVFFGGDPDSPDTLGSFYADVQMYANSGVDPESYFGS